MPIADERERARIATVYGLTEPPYFRHAKSPELGVCILIRKLSDRRTYLFEDGVERSFKEDFCERFIEPAPPPDAEVRVRLGRGMGSGGATPKAIHLELEAAIREKPQDAEPYLVYADWLQERGDPRGELIAIQSKRQVAPDDKKLQAAEAALFAAQGKYLVPPLLAEMLAHPRRKTDAPGTRTTASWFMGFLQGVRIARRSEQQPEPATILEELVRHPSAQFLRSIVIGPLGATNKFDFKPVVAALGQRLPPLLDELVIGDFGPEHIELDFTSLANVSPLLAAPNLRRLVVRAGTLRFDAPIEHAALRELSVTAVDLTQKTIGRLIDAAVPALEVLEISAAPLDLEIKQLDKLLRRKDRTQLRRLALRHTTKTATVFAEIVRSPLMRQLEVLDLGDGDMTDAVVELVERHAEALGRVELLLSGNRLSQAAAVRIAKLCGTVKIGKQGTRNALTAMQVLSRAPDARSAAAARELARPAEWLVVARDGDRIWGEYEGSNHYYVFARLSTEQTGCSCPSPKNPCKHALALLLIATDHELPTRTAPDALIRNTQSRPRYTSLWE
ncbi:MAG: hypothetical protein JWO36_1671 [Myxococcales bacterium]|nr:hypothetical protein [Myxococcales bacterium]